MGMVVINFKNHNISIPLMPFDIKLFNKMTLYALHYFRSAISALLLIPVQTRVWLFEKGLEL